MQVIELKHPYDPKLIVDQPVVLALGFFDGVHLGHQEVIQAAGKEAKKRGIKLAVMTFNHTPQLVYAKIHPHTYTYLSPVKRKMELFEAQGVDIVYIAEFTYDMGAQAPEEFVENYIKGLNAQAVVAGCDYTYGKKDIANMQTLPVHAKGNFSVIEIPQQTLHSHKIGTTSIRQFIIQGDIESANRELGYTYQTSGTVINGEKRGRSIGYPTANIATGFCETVPGIGVYIVELWVKGHWYQGMASVGYNVTFTKEKNLSVEVYILNFNQMIYGEEVKIKWWKYLRGELKFEAVEGLVKQLDADLIETQNFFKT